MPRDDGHAPTSGRGLAASERSSARSSQPSCPPPTSDWVILRSLAHLCHGPQRSVPRSGGHTAGGDAGARSAQGRRRRSCNRRRTRSPPRSDFASKLLRPDMMSCRDHHSSPPSERRSGCRRPGPGTGRSSSETRATPRGVSVVSSRSETRSNPPTGCRRHDPADCLGRSLRRPRRLSTSGNLRL